LNKKRLAERVLGAVLVCSFGFILYSAFLDYEGEQFVDRNTRIPVQTSSMEPLDLPDPPEPVASPDTSAAEIFVPEEEASAEEALDAPVLDQGEPNAWVIQVGSFSSLEKADEVRDQLIGQDYRAYHRAISSNQDTLYRVLIGPYTNAEEAVRHQRAVDTLLDISTMLMKFTP
jgi:DedD protein